MPKQKNDDDFDKRKSLKASDALAVSQKNEPDLQAFVTADENDPLIGARVKQIEKQSVRAQHHMTAEEKQKHQADVAQAKKVASKIVNVHRVEDNKEANDAYPDQAGSCYTGATSHCCAPKSWKSDAQLKDSYTAASKDSCQKPCKKAHVCLKPQTAKPCVAQRLCPP